MTKKRNGNGARNRSRASPPITRPPGQIVLVLQGGGALGAYQAGVYQALHEAEIEPDWVIGTSIGAINAALIAGNAPRDRLARMREFWESIEWRAPFSTATPNEIHAPSNWGAEWFNPFVNLQTIARGVDGFFEPNPPAWWGLHTPLGLDRAAFYSTAPLRKTLDGLVDFARIRRNETRITVGAVNAKSGAMRYFDSREETLTPEHIMASGALPPAFPVIRIDDEPYWDGGIFSNTPIEAVLDDYPRRSSTIFNVHLWNPSGDEPQSIWQVLGRQKEIQYASRAATHIERQRQLHHLRHIVSELAAHLPAKVRAQPAVNELCTWGCRTTMHIVRLLAPRLPSEDHTKDIDFTPGGIHARWEAGYVDTQDALRAAPWTKPVDPIEGIVVHEHESTSAM
jgi:NTE family protein